MPQPPYDAHGQQAAASPNSPMDLAGDVTAAAIEASGGVWAARGFALLAEYQADEHGPYRAAADALDDVLPGDAPPWLRQGALKVLQGRAGQR